MSEPSIITEQSPWKPFSLAAGREAFGPGVAIHLAQRRHGGYVAWAIDALGNVLAIGGGATEAAAWRMLADQIVDYRGIFPDSTDAANILGVTRSAIRQLVRLGLLNPFTPGNKRNVSRFTPAELARVALSRKRVVQRVTASADDPSGAQQTPEGAR